jgi:hypothetical protein
VESAGSLRNVRFSNRPFGVKHFQTIHRSSVDVAHGLVLLFGIGTKALPAWDSRTRCNNLSHGLAVGRTAGSYLSFGYNACPRLQCCYLLAARLYLSTKRIGDRRYIRPRKDETMMTWLFSYCRTNPNKSIVDAALQLSDALRQH